MVSEGYAYETPIIKPYKNQTKYKQAQKMPVKISSVYGLIMVVRVK